MSLPNVSSVDSWRNRLAQRLANAALAIADEEYRMWIRGAIEYGLRSCARDLAEGREAP